MLMTGLARAATLFCASGVFAGVLGFAAFDRARMVELFTWGGFYFILASFVLWAVTMLRRSRLACGWSGLWREHGVAALLALALVGCAFLASPPAFRILFDEANLAGIAMGMYEERSVAIPENGYFAGGVYTGVTRVLDKRPLTFPFLMYAADALFGTRGASGFVVNFAAGWAALVLFSMLLRRWFSPCWARLGIVLLGSYPQFVLWTTSSGFEMLNLAFILLAFYLLDVFVETRRAGDAERLAMTLVLLAQCRYESTLFLAVLLPLIPLLLPREEYGRLSPAVLVLPLLLVPVAWQQMLFFRADEHQLDTGGPIFSLAYVLPHVGKALTCLSGAQERFGMSAPLFWVAVAGLAAGVWQAIRRQLWRERRFLIVAVAWCCSYGLLSLTQFAYHMGDLTAPITMRLALVYLPALVFFSLCAARALTRRQPGLRAWLWSAALALLLFAWPVAGKDQALRTLNAYRNYERSLQYLRDNYPRRDVLVLAERGHLYLIHGYSSINFLFAGDNLARLLEMRQAGLFQDVLAIQEVTAAGQPCKEFELPPGTFLNVLYAEQLDDRTMLRISRVDEGP